MSCETEQGKIPVITLPSTRKGDTWDGIPSASLSSTGTAFNNPLSSVRMSFWAAGASASSLDLNSSDSKITIADADAWEFEVLPVSPMTLTAGHYSWQIQTTDSADRIKTYLQGVIEITSDQTI